MKCIKLLVGLALASALFTFAANSQTASPPDTNAPVKITQNVDQLALPSSKGDYWKFAIAGVAPMIVLGIKKLVPKIPKMWLPLSTPLIGLALGAGLNALGASHLGWLDMGQAGALAVFVRESFNQTVQACGGGQGST